MNLFFSLFSLKDFGWVSPVKTFSQELKEKEKRDAYLPQRSRKVNTASSKGIVSRSNYRLFCNRRHQDNIMELDYMYDICNVLQVKGWEEIVSDKPFWVFIKRNWKCIINWKSNSIKFIKLQVCSFLLERFQTVVLLLSIQSRFSSDLPCFPFQQRCVQLCSRRLYARKLKVQFVSVKL